jgi:uncharacterized FAD-dependent dehydrogenase
MAEIVDIFVPLDEVAPEPDEGRGQDDGAERAVIDGAPGALASRAEQALGWPRGSAGALRVLRRALDARKNRALGFRLRVEVARAGEPLPPPGSSSPPPRATRAGWPAGRPPPRVVIVGSGPAGTWAALRLAEAGVTSRIVEIGKPVQPRRQGLASLNRGSLDPRSNYCFGEGGAGTYSDGKLYTRAKDRGGVAEVLADLVRFGAPADVEIDSRPHVGSNRLPKVLTALRAHLESIGVVYHFETEVTGARVERDRLRALRLEGGGEIEADVAVLAVGHSARSVYAWADAAGIALERKAIAVGVRLEHPQPVIDRIQYGRAAGHPRLPPAFYELRAERGDRGVYSFCMCPGGWIVPAATEPDGVVVNGMSLSRRDSAFANAGFVVTVDPADFGPAALGRLAGVEFQRAIEREAFRVGGGGFRAPAQRLVEFLGAGAPAPLGPTSYHPQLAAADLGEVLPPFVAHALREGLREIAARVPGFLDPRAQLIAAETRTSAPVRILRDPVTLHSPSLPGLYPAGEGAGYAGGIVSAALDGARIAERILATAG